MSDRKSIAVIGATGAQGGGLVRAILADPQGPSQSVRSRARPIPTRRVPWPRRAQWSCPPTPTTRPASSAPSGAHGAFLVTDFWEHFSPERELKQAAAMARATKAAGVAHAVWSTLEDTRLAFPLDDPRLKTLQGIAVLLSPDVVVHFLDCGGCCSCRATGILELRTPAPG